MLLWRGSGRVQEGDKLSLDASYIFAQFSNCRVALSPQGMSICLGMSWERIKEALSELKEYQIVFPVAPTTTSANSTEETPNSRRTHGELRMLEYAYLSL